MRRDLVTIVFTLFGVLSMATVPQALLAQEQERYTDFRGRTYSAEELGEALFGAEPIFRGVRPQQPSPPPKSAVALNVFYAFDSAKILEQHHADVDKLGSVLTQPQYRDYRIRIEGHTDSVGTEPYNQNLSERRAESVKRYLVQRFAIAPERLVVQGYGESQPRETNATEKGRSLNRRVEVVNLGQ